MRCLVAKIFILARLVLDKSRVTTADAERLKRNTCYAVHEYKSHGFDTFKQMVWAVLDHHFGCHDNCGPWCPWLKNQDKPEELKKLFYRDKIKDKAIYDQILEIWRTYCSDKPLRDIHHEWHTNKCESMNNFICKFIPKTTHLCMSIVGQARTYLAVGLDSVGYEDYYRTLFGILGLHYNENVCGLSHQRLDNNKKYQRTYFKRPNVRRDRCKKRAIKIREMIHKVLQDKKKGYTYKSGMSGPQIAKKEKRQTGVLVQCKYCLKANKGKYK
jgi:hypothetical protein